MWDDVLFKHNDYVPTGTKTIININIRAPFHLPEKKISIFFSDDSPRSTNHNASGTAPPGGTLECVLCEVLW